MKEALKDSRHMIVLWSENARKSDWVDKETGFFSVDISKSDRKLIPIVLNDQPKALNSTQFIMDIKEKELYEPGAKALADVVWNKIIRDVMRSINSDKVIIPLHLAVLTLTHAEITDPAKVDFTRVPFKGQKLDDILSAAGLTREQITGQYGPARMDWKPFGGTKTIDLLLEEMLSSINSRGRVKFEWKEIGESLLWSDDPGNFDEAAEILKKQYSVIIVDPVALYHLDIKELFDRLLVCLENKYAVVMALSAFGPSPGYSSWRKIIESSANRFHRHYFDPPLPKEKLMAAFTANPLDEMDTRRFIQDLAGGLSSIGPDDKTPFLSQ